MRTTPALPAMGAALSTDGTLAVTASGSFTVSGSWTWTATGTSSGGRG
ncbi:MULTISPECIES: hypothetical protein [unclassified Streptomyces]|nr:MULTISPECIES: hypothetical protein [unclassified Streptomyces]MCH0563050.1 hypothetical protein [Streptomyces sp. MUM 2J]MCH0570320.1 hypothetical protein [Streptomyces sp. MUM 136J]